MARDESDFERIIANAYPLELKLVSLHDGPIAEAYETVLVQPTIEMLLKSHDLFLLGAIGLDPDVYDEKEDHFITALEAKLMIEHGTDVLVSNVGSLAVKVESDVELAWDITNPDAAVAGHFAGLWAGGWYDAPSREELGESSDEYYRENGVLLAIDNGHLHADGGIYEVGSRAYVPLNYGKPTLTRIMPNQPVKQSKEAAG